jgi:hypothetical protein
MINFQHPLSEASSEALTCLQAAASARRAEYAEESAGEAL